MSSLSAVADGRHARDAGAAVTVDDYPEVAFNSEEFCERRSRSRPAADSWKPVPSVGPPKRCAQPTTRLQDRAHGRYVHARTADTKTLIRAWQQAWAATADLQQAVARPAPEWHIQV